MSGREFIDTNVLVYADDARDRRKQARARELIRRLMRERRGVLSLQILQGFFIEDVLLTDPFATDSQTR